VPLKQWSEEGWAELTDLLVDAGHETVIFGGPGDIATVDKITQATRTRPAVLAGKLSLLELAAAVNRCSVFVSVDSGPLHVAASQNVPIVGLYGPTDPTEFGPYRVPNAVLGNREGCVGCRRGSESGHTCIHSLRPEDVSEAVRNLLSPA
jgi:heptosyltransferase-2